VQNRIFNYTLRLVAAQYRWRSLGLALLLAIAYYFILLKVVFGISPTPYVQFLEKRRFKEDRRILSDQLREGDRSIESYQKDSFLNHQKLSKLLSSRFEEDPRRSEDLAKAIKLSNHNQDAIRALLEIGRFYTDLVKNGHHSQNTHDILLKLYEAVVLVMQDDCSSFHEAYTTLNSLEENQASWRRSFPDTIQPDIHIEILRYLSYSAARISSEKCPTGEEETTDFLEQQENYTKKAKTEMDYKLIGKSLTQDEYLRSFYWIDLSSLFSSVQRMGRSDNNKNEYITAEKDAEESFSRLEQYLGPYGNRPSQHPFLRDKMIQHKISLISSTDSQDEEVKTKTERIWDKYISRINISPKYCQHNTKLDTELPVLCRTLAALGAAGEKDMAAKTFLQLGAGEGAARKSPPLRQRVN